MKVSENFVMRAVMDEYVIVPVGSAALDFNGIMSTNETGAFLWNLLGTDTTAASLAEAMAAEYGIDRDVALEDTLLFLNQLKEQSIIESIDL